MLDVGRLIRWAAKLGPVVGLQAFRMVTELLHKNLIPRPSTHPPPSNHNYQLLTHSYQHQQGHHTHLQTATRDESGHGGVSMGTSSHVNYTQRNIITETEFGEIIAMGLVCEYYCCSSHDILSLHVFSVPFSHPLLSSPHPLHTHSHRFIIHTLNSSYTPSTHPRYPVVAVHFLNSTNGNLYYIRTRLLPQVHPLQIHPSPINTFDRTFLVRRVCPYRL